MRRRLHIECGAAETRAACFIDDDPVRFFFAPARGDEHLPRPVEAGDVVLGRVRTISKSLHAAFVDIGEAEDGFLQAKASEALPVEGARLIVIVARPAIGSKGALISPHWRKSFSEDACVAIAARAETAAPPARLSDSRDPALWALAAAGAAPGDAVLVNDPAVAVLLREATERSGVGRDAVAIAEASLRDIGVDDAIDAALERTVVVADGVRLTFDETEAMTVVDVDSGGAGAQARTALNDRVNAAAAAALFGELSRRGVGGRIIVDFPPPSNARARARLFDQLSQASRQYFPARLGKLSADGVFDLTAARTGASLLERASETAAGPGWLRRGRRLTLDWQAKAAIRSLEAQLQRALSARLTLAVDRTIEDYLASRPQWRDRLAARFGARFDIVGDLELEDRAFDVIERRK